MNFIFSIETVDHVDHSLKGLAKFSSYYNFSEMPQNYLPKERSEIGSAKQETHRNLI